jgi:hypothetical protein
MIVLLTNQEAREAVQAILNIEEVDNESLSKIFDTDSSVQLWEPATSSDREVVTW